MADYGFVQHGFKWFVTAKGRRIGEGFQWPQDAQAEARHMAAKKIPIPDSKPKPRGRAREVKAPQEAAPE